MVSFEFDEVFVALVSVVEHLAVVRLNKIVTGGRCKQGWYKRVLHVINRRKLVDVEIGLALNRTGH